MSIRYLKYLLAAAAAFILAQACVRDSLDELEASFEEGRKTYVNLSVGMPAMNVATRAEMPDDSDNEVNTLWVGIFSARTGKCTYAGYHNDSGELPGLHNPFVTLSRLKTESGSSYIVAVGNPENNYGYQYDPANASQRVTRALLTTILPESAEKAQAADFTWDKYTALAIRQLDLNDINTPIGNLVMSGVYYKSTEDPAKASEWESANYSPVQIPVATSGAVTLKGAVHLRRLISQVKFTIQAVDYDNAGSNANKRGKRIIGVIPHAYRVVNVPYISWLHERRSPTADANAGDVVRISNSSITYATGDMALRSNYRSSVSFNGNQYIDEIKKTLDDGTTATDHYEFDFWMLENKRRALQNGLLYDQREKEIKTVSGDNSLNTGIYTALCGDGGSETMNNCAAFVEIECRVLYLDEGLEAIRKDEQFSEVQYRSADAVYTVHLGGIGNDWSDFTHRRNHRYTYNITVMDVDRIIVEALEDDESRPGIEGVVTDVVNPPFEMDAHYGVVNIKLSNLERTGGSGNAEYADHKFPFRIRVYDGDGNAVFLDQEDYDSFDPKYWQWIELRATTDSLVLAEYKPHNYNFQPGEHKTFRLNEIADLEKFPGVNGSTDKQDRTQQWYTVFVNEYVYEDSDDESGIGNKWTEYVNKPPRMCWFNTLGGSSKDEESNYIRSKYVVRQQSIQTFYTIPAGREYEDIDAIGAEHTNEVFGFNLRWDDITTEYSEYLDNDSHTIKNNNGRHNTLLYLKGTPARDGTGYIKGGRGSQWSAYLDQTRLQFVTDLNKTPNQNYLGELPDPNVPFYVPAATTSTTGTDLGSSDINARYYLRILDACMNRNRDNNGNGVIDKEEIRWYVPASSEIVDLVLGRNSLETPLLDYGRNYALNSPSYDLKTEQAHQSNTRFHFATSNQRVLWAEEGTSINPEVDTADWYDSGNGVMKWNWNLPPQQVRCVRALGTNLETDLNADLSPAFTTNAEYNGGRPTEIYPTYYELKNQRAYTSEAIHPHQETSTLNRLCYDGFEFSEKLYEFEDYQESQWVEDKRIETIPAHYEFPEGYYTEDNTYLGATVNDAKNRSFEIIGPTRRDEWHSGEYHEGGMYLPDPDSYSPTQKPGYQRFDAFWVGGVDHEEGWYKPDTGTYSDTGGDGYVWWDSFPVESTGHSAAWYKPDMSQYGGGDKNKKPAEGVYDWWEEKELPDPSTYHPAGWYKPDPNDYSSTQKDGYIYISAPFGDESTFHKKGKYLPDASNYSDSPKDGYYQWNAFYDNYHPAGNYAPDLKTYSPNPFEGGVWFNESYGNYQAGYYKPDPNSLNGPGSQWIGQPFYSGEYHPAGYYKPDTSASVLGEYDYTTDPRYKLIDAWYDRYCPAGWYKLGSYVNADQWHSPGDGYTYFESFYDKYFPAGWYKPYLPSQANVDNPWNNPDQNSNYHYFQKWYDEYYPEGWYRADESQRGNNSQEGYKPYPSWHEGGTRYPAGYYAPDPGSRADGDPYYNPDSRYKHFDGFWDETLPGGYYTDNGNYYGTTEAEAKEACWSEIKPQWREASGKYYPEETKEVDYSRWEHKSTGTWTDPYGTTGHLFVLPYNNGNPDLNTFVENHGITLRAANQVCKRLDRETGRPGWRLPNMKEAALIKIAMDNAGVYKTNGLTYQKDVVNGYDVGNFLSCTYREFGVDGGQSRADQTGYYTGVYYPEVENEVQGDWQDAVGGPLLGRICCITTHWNRHYYIRCVRDLQSSGE